MAGLAKLRPSASLRNFAVRAGHSAWRICWDSVGYRATGASAELVCSRHFHYSSFCVQRPDGDARVCGSAVAMRCCVPAVAATSFRCSWRRTTLAFRQHRLAWRARRSGRHPAMVAALAVVASLAPPSPLQPRRDAEVAGSDKLSGETEDAQLRDRSARWLLLRRANKLWQRRRWHRHLAHSKRDNRRQARSRSTQPPSLAQNPDGDRSGSYGLLRRSSGLTLGNPFRPFGKGREAVLKALNNTATKYP